MLKGFPFGQIPFTAMLLALLSPWMVLAADPIEVRVPMSDGIELVTVVHLPGDGKGQYPVMLERSPYPRSDDDRGWNRDGVAYVLQSVRGRFGSQGEYRPFADEGWGEHRDGADTVRWILEQPWCNGQVGTIGGSASAINAALLGPASPELKCQILQEGCGNLVDHIVYGGGSFRKSLVEGWLQFGVQIPAYADVWKAQAPDSDYWLGYNTRAQASQVTAPGLHVGGWWDIFADGTIDEFLARQKSGGAGAQGRQILVMRPTAHGPWGAQALKFPENHDDFRVTPFRRRFAIRWLTGKDDGLDQEPAVHYYTIGDDQHFDGPGWEWRTADTWPPFAMEPTPYYLHANGNLSTEAPTSRDYRRGFVFDPADPVPTVGGQNLVIPYGPFDQREVSSRADVLCFQTPVLAEPLETTGHFRVRLYISSDAPDTDFTAKLVDIYPEGDERQILMLDSIRRVRYREGNQRSEPLEPGQIVPVEIDLGNISWIFNTGHRIGLQISSSNYPRFEVNPNDGRDFPTKDQPGQRATNQVHVNSDNPSVLFLPVRKP